MKLLQVFLPALAFLLISANVFALEGPTAGTLSVSASENGFFRPDTAQLTVAVETTEKTVDLAARENARKANAVVKELKAFLNKKIGESIKTSLYTVQPVYTWDTARKKNILTGYRVINQIVIKTHRTGLVSRLIDSAIAAGANRMDSLNFSLENQTAYCTELIVKATQKAMQRAKTLAATLGVKLGKVKNASSSCERSRSFGPIGRSMLEARKVQGPATPIEGGQSELSATAKIVFLIE